MNSSRRALLLVSLSSTTAISLLFALSACTQQRGACDPRIRGFWRNLSCRAEWGRRIAAREQRIHTLNEEYTALVGRNANLRTEIVAAKQYLTSLEPDFIESERILQEIRQTAYTPENAIQQVRTLEAEIKFILSTIEVLERNGMSRFPPPASDSVQEIQRSKGFLKDALALIAESIITSSVIKGLFALLPQTRILRIVKEGALAISNLMTLKGGVDLLNEHSN